MEVTKKIITLNDQIPYTAFKREKEYEFVTIDEATLFSAMKNVMRGVGIAITNTTAYYLCAVNFGTNYIKGWDKSKYNKLISVDAILSIVDDNPDVFRLEKMNR